MARPIRENLLTFEHDTDAFEHPKFIALRTRFGWEGEGMFWALNCMIGRSNGCCLDISKAFQRAAIIQKLGMTEAYFNAFVTFLADPEACGLLTTDGEKLWTDRTQVELKRATRARQSERERKGEDRKELSGGKDTENHGSPAGHAPDNHDNPSVNDRKTGFSGVPSLPLPSLPLPSLPLPSGRKSDGEHESLGSAALVQGRDATPAAAAPFASLLKSTLEASGIVLSQQDLDAVAVKCIAASCDSAAFVTWAIQQAAKAKQRGTWIVKGVLSWNWCAKFKAQATAPAPSAPKPSSYVAPELHQPSAEDDAQVEIEAARTRKRMHMPLSDRDREILGEPALNAEQPVDNRSPPGVDNRVDNLPDEFPEPAAMAEVDIF